ncbi:MAG: extracellular solute-binding protein, partial [Patescibacteria group bacterium]
MNLSFLTSANRLVYILVAGIAILVFLTIILVLRSFGGSGEPVTLQFWGVFDTRASFERTIREFQGLYPNVKIQYTQLNYEDYERTLIDKLAAGQGPDILMIHNTWLPKHGDKLMPLDESWRDVNDNPLMTIRDFKTTFVDVAAQDLVFNGRIYSLPLYVDTLALYYNKDLLNGASLTRPPVTWDDFNTSVEKLTRLDSSGNIVQSGAAIGTARNINRSTDILMSLMIQSGTQMTNPENTSATFTRSVDNQRIGEIALQYYTDFTKPEKRTYSWNDAQHYSIDAFAEGTTAMMFNYSHQISLLRAKSPRLNFSVAPIPQLSSSDPRTFPN